MASIRRRNGKYQAQIRRANQQIISRVFLKKADVQLWVRIVEAGIDLRGDLLVMTFSMSRPIH